MSIKVFLFSPVEEYCGALFLFFKWDSYCPGAGNFAIYYAIKLLTFWRHEYPLFFLLLSSTKPVFSYTAGPGVTYPWIKSVFLVY